MWLLYALLSGLLYTGSNLVTRHVMKKEYNDSWALSFFFSAVGALVTLPFMVSQPKISTQIMPWLSMLLLGVVIVVHNYLSFASSRHITPSVQGSINKFRLVWIMILGIFILHESSSILKIVGTISTVISGTLIMKKLAKPKDMRGVVYAFGATVIYAFVILLYKYLFSSFNALSLTFFTFLIPTIINFIVMPDSIRRIRTLAKKNFGVVFFGCAIGGLASLTMTQGLSIGEASKVLVIVESCLVFTLLGEHIVLKEKDDLLSKIVAVIFATVGAILIRIS